MKFLISWTTIPALFHTGLSRFLETGGRPPSGVTLTARWFGMNGRGVAIADTQDASALFAWVSEWSDVLHIEVTPCVDDAEAGPVLQSLKRR